MAMGPGAPSWRFSDSFLHDLEDKSQSRISELAVDTKRVRIGMLVQPG